ncbi:MULTISPECIES: HRDC domain-containing protein [Nitrospirillum]|uniref:HRDC domain-containing protein n=1 Tax=Nitrospirillum amazonense TaxID=28077 RepID=A0A560GND0_9PROT|nr:MULTISPECIES: HRDC domain-containing protein [Nitrospirillum]MDZ5646052.1 HRDC domain-containing protein [Nitrospirillum sp. BR 11828]TWB35179.1 HRDC domain-containing protein [Nitrospirillum amazonense]
MTLEIRTFSIRDAVHDEDETRLASFLRTVEVSRIDTAYADGAWRVLVQYRDLRRKEETAQIESAIISAINSWRTDVAKALGVDKEEILSNSVVAEIARYAPTTEIELSVISNAAGFDVAGRGGQIVQIVRQTMEELTN